MMVIMVILGQLKMFSPPFSLFGLLIGSVGIRV